MKRLWRTLLSLAFLCGWAAGIAGCASGGAITGTQVSVTLKEYGLGLRNPLKGLRGQDSFDTEFSTLAKWYVKWKDIEDNGNDGVQKLLDYGGARWSIAHYTNNKVIPRVYLNWPGREDADGGNYWPSDMTAGDYGSAQFKDRVVKLIRKMAAAWDNDPRVAFIEMGLVGQWGEQHTPSPSDTIQQLLAESFDTYFKNKLVMVRNPSSYLYRKTNFGLYWDEWGSDMQWHTWEKVNVVLGEPYADRWKTAVYGGENTNNLYGFGNEGGRFMTFGIPYPFTAEEAFKTKLTTMIDYARLTHTNHMETAHPSKNDSDADMNMQTFQNTLGYRFVISNARYHDSARPGGRFQVSFDVSNTGSSPFYYDWPVQITLLDPETRKAVWGDIMDGVSTVDWMPGEHWSTEKSAYDKPAETYTAKATMRLPKSVAKGNYLLAVTMLDPAGMQPAAVFANRNYAKGGYTVLGAFGVGQSPAALPADYKYDAPKGDMAPRYYLNISSHTSCEEAPEAVDGTVTSVWTAKDTKARNITVNLGQSRKVKSLEVVWENAADYTVETSSDGRKWESCGESIHKARGSVTRSYLVRDQVQYVRLKLKKQRDGAPAAIRAINVYGE